MQRQAAQVRQGRVAGAEVVHRQPDAQLRQRCAGSASAARSRRAAVLGHLEGEQLRRDTVLVQQRRHPRREGGVDQGREDRLTAIGSGWPSSDHCRHRRNPSTQHRLGQPTEQAGVLGHGHEVLRRYQTVRRVLPAGQALHPDQPAVRQRHLGLEVHLQLASLHRLPQVRGDPQPPGRTRLKGRVEQLHPAGELAAPPGLATSARCSRVAGSVPWSGCTATPTATSTSSLSEPTGMGRRTSERSAPASRTAASAEGSRRVTTNSSPPARPTSAEDGAAVRRRSASSPATDRRRRGPATR